MMIQFPCSELRCWWVRSGRHTRKGSEQSGVVQVLGSDVTHSTDLDNFLLQERKSNLEFKEISWCSSNHLVNNKEALPKELAWGALFNQSYVFQSGMGKAECGVNLNPPTSRIALKICLQISIPPSVSQYHGYLRCCCKEGKLGMDRARCCCSGCFLSGVGLPQQRALGNNLIYCLSKLPTSLLIASILETK